MATPADTVRPFSGVDLRRSTRVDHTVHLIVSGQNRLGQQFQEKTSALSLNLHGCRYPSRHDYRIGSWVTLQVAEPSGETRTRLVRALVRSIHTPVSPRDLYQIGVELEAPGNVWGITAPPEDWLRVRADKGAMMQFGAAVAPAREAPAAPRLVPAPMPEPRHAEVAAFPAPAPPAATSLPLPVRQAGASADEAETTETPPAPPKQRVVITPEMIVSALQGKLQQAAENAVQAAAGMHLEEAAKKAIATIDAVCRASVGQIEEATARRVDALVNSSREEILAQLDPRVDELLGRREGQLESYRSQIEEIVGRLEKAAADARRNLAETHGLLEKITRELEPQMRARLDEAVSRAAREFEGGAARVCERQLVRLLEESQSVTREVSAQIEARAAEARSLVQSAASVALDEFRRQASVQAELAISETNQRVVSSLASLDAENRAACEARRRSLEGEVARAAEQSTEQFRKAIKAFLYSCLVAAVSAVDEHTQSTLEGLVRNDGTVLPQIGEPSPSSEHGENGETRNDLLPH